MRVRHGWPMVMYVVCVTGLLVLKMVYMTERKQDRRQAAATAPDRREQQGRLDAAACYQQAFTTTTRERNVAICNAYSPFFDARACQRAVSWTELEIRRAGVCQSDPARERALSQ